MSNRSLRIFWWTLIVFVPLLTIYSGNYAYQTVARYGDNVSFTSCPAVIAYPQEGPCVAALQRLLNADPPYAGIYHDGIFGPQTLAATLDFQSRYGLPGQGKADVATTRVLSRLAPAPRPVPVAATLLTLTLTGMVVLGLMTARRRSERQLSAQPPEIDASAMVRAAI
jgi:peptidoglycan hydrolase-like protein with peptidoglycan-binding domain